jgi:Diacylglycerol acyltransferase
MAPSAAVVTEKIPNGDKSLQWWLGLFMACCFSMIYFVAPFYILSSLVLSIYYYKTLWLWIYIAPMLVSMAIPPLYMPQWISFLSPMLSYFDYTEIHESKPINVFEEIGKSNKNFLCIFQPHGVISFVGILSAVYNAQKQATNSATNTPSRVIPPTAVASALLYTPILKHVLGIFGLISASKHSMQRTLKKKGVDGTIVLYVGGMAELFLSCHQEEKLYLLKRKGFIKLALQEGIDVVPVYLFANSC